MAQEVGVAYVTLLPSGKGFGKSVEGQIDSALGKSDKKTDGFLSKVGTGVKRVGLGVAALVGTVGALAVGGGISRALNIEDAQAKLKGLGHDTKSVETIMTNALASVKGTAFGLDAAATTAASAVASGIKPGQELERYLRLTADAATIAGVSMEEMGSIINKVQAKGKAQTEDLNRLTERGIPILQMLADEYGVTAEEMSQMVTRGEVDSERFRKALEDNVGGAALASGDTTRGAFANMMAALSRFGLVFAGPALGQVKTFFNEVTIILDGLAERMAPWAEKINEQFGDALNPDGIGERFLAGFDRMVAAFESGPIPQLLTALQPVLPALAEMAGIIGGALGDAFMELGAALAPVLPMLSESLADAVVQLAPALTDVLVALLPLVPSLVELLAAATPLVVLLVDLLVPVLQWIAEGLTKDTSAFSSLFSLLAGDESVEGFIETMRNGTNILSIVTNAAMSTGEAIGSFGNKVALVVAGVGVVLANLAAYFRNAWAGAVAAVSSGVESVVSYVGGLPGRIASALVGLGGLLFSLGQNMIQGLINGVGSMIGNAVAAVKNVGGAMLEGVQSFLGIHSPSRVFRDEVGKMVGLGLLAGIEDEAIAGRIDSAVNHMVSIPETARANGMQDTFVLLDEDGSILSKTRVVARSEVDANEEQRGAAMRYARR